MALESSPFSRKTPERSSVERKELPRAEKPEALDVYSLPIEASRGSEAVVALNTFYDGWEQYATDRNYFEKGEGPMSALREKQNEAKSTALKIRDAYLEYTAAKSKEKELESIIPSDRFKGVNSMQEFKERKEREKEASEAPSAAWEGYQERLKDLEGTLKEQLKEMNGPLAQQVEEAVAENEAYIYKREKSSEEYRAEMGESVKELAALSPESAPSPLEENRRRFEEVIKPAVEQKYEKQAGALDGKSKGLFSKMRGWFGGGEDKPKSGLGKKMAFLGALGALIGVGVGTYDNAPRRTEKVTRVQQNSASPEASGVSAPPMPETIQMTQAEVELEVATAAPKKRWTTTRTSAAPAESPVAASTAEYISPIKNVIPLPEGMDPNSPEATAFLNRAYNPEVFAESEQSTT